MFSAPLPSSGVPVVVSLCIRSLRKRGIKEEGLLRVSGSQKEIEALKQAFEKGGSAGVREAKRLMAKSIHHSVAGLLKLYLRELPEPLLTHELYESWKKVTRAEDVEGSKEVVSKMPSANRETLCELFRFLKEVEANSESNKMSSRNIAIVIGPNLIWPTGSFGNQLASSTPRTAMLETTETSGIAAFILTHCDELFPREAPAATGGDEDDGEDEGGEGGGGGKSKEPVDGERKDEKEKPKRQKKKGDLFCVHVRGTLPLRPGTHFLHPVAFVHILSKQTGEYLSIDGRHILPILTQPFPCADSSKPFSPAWEEDVVFAEDFDEVVTDEALILFEVLDFGLFSITKGIQKGFVPIAWGFLLPVGHTGTETRLQLFKYTVTRAAQFSCRQAVPDVFFSWKKKRKEYPSSLLVTLLPKKRPESSEIVAVSRPTLPGQTQLLSKSFQEMQRERGMATDGEPEKVGKSGGGEGAEDEETEGGDEKPAAPPAIIWARKPGDQCQVPNRITSRVDALSGGCAAMSFSHNGLSLAVVTSDSLTFPLLVFRIPSWTIASTFPGHHGLVYDVSWTADDSKIVTASADGTAKVCPADDPTAVRVLQHPYFVYCARANPGSGLVFTGALDCKIRLWEIGQAEAKVVGELEGHASHVNALVFAGDGKKMFSGDGAGELRVWLAADDNPAKFSCFRTIDRFSGFPVNHLAMHPTRHRLIVHVRNATISELDSRHYSVIRTFSGHQNTAWQLRSALSPDGRFLVSGSESESIYVWSCETGAVVRVFEDVGLRGSPPTVAWHPFENMIAVSALGLSYPIIVYTWDKQLDSPKMIATAEVAEDRGDLLGTAEGTVDASSAADARAEQFRDAFTAMMLQGTMSVEPPAPASTPDEQPTQLPALQHPRQLKPLKSARDESARQKPRSPEVRKTPRTQAAERSTEAVPSLPPILSTSRRSASHVGPEERQPEGEQDTLADSRMLERLVRQRRRENELARAITSEDPGAALPGTLPEISPLPSDRFHMTIEAVRAREASLNATLGPATSGDGAGERLSATTPM